MRIAPCLAVIAALTVIAVQAPAASAANNPTVWLNDQSGVLSITGTGTNDWFEVSKVLSPLTPGGYDLVIESHNSDASNFSANCIEGGGQGEWMVVCPALNVKRLTFDGKEAHDSFINRTAYPSEAHGGPGVEVFYGGSGPDTFFGDGDEDELEGRGGDDVIDGGGAADDLLGGTGTDTVSYATATGPVKAALDISFDNGVAGENEYIAPDFENVQGGLYADVLRGNSKPNALRGGDGADDLDGYAGDDLLNGQAGDDVLRHNQGADILHGGTEQDTLSYYGANTRVTVYQDYQANDGMGDEHDDVRMVEKLTGSAHGDDLEGTTGDDVIDGGGGGDKIDAKFGDDVVKGGPGPDNIIGGPGMPAQCGNSGCTEFDTDHVYGGSESDTIDYSSRSGALTIALDPSEPSGGFMEADRLASMESAVGGDGDDTITGNNAPNALYGLGGGDGIEGGDGNDYVSGGEEHDFVSGGANEDYVAAGAGDDVLLGGQGRDTIEGGTGHDLADFSGETSGVVIHLGGAQGDTDKVLGDVEDLEGSHKADHLYGDGDANKLTGWGGDDVLAGGDGNDVLKGGWGDDKHVGNGGADTADYSDHATGVSVQLITAAPGDGAPGEKDVNHGMERVVGSAYDDTITGNDLDNSIDGNAGEDVIRGNGGKDILSGAAGGDDLGGGGGDDVLFPGTGKNVLAGGNGIDWVSYSGFSAPVTVTLGDKLANDGPAGAGDNVGASVENVAGGSGDDTLTGTSAANELTGGSGADELSGRGGKDKLSGGPDADKLWSSGDQAVDADACGTAADEVIADAIDVIAADCEAVTKS